MKHSIDTSNWGEFEVGELFDLKGIKQVKSQHHVVEREDGIPFVVQSNRNNMVKHLADRQWLIDNNEPVVEGNAIVLGVTLPVVSYQESEFGASQVITARNPNLTKNSGLFIASVMTAFLVPKYSYINKPGLQKYKDDIIPLPLKPNTNPDNYTQDDIDWYYMESFMSRVEDAAKERLDNLPEPGQKSKTPVDIDGWGEFKLTDIAKLTNGNKFDKNKMTRDNTSINLVSRTGFNNGVSDFVDKIDGVEPYPAGAITLALGGSAGSTFVQTAPFYTGQNVGVIEFENKSFLAKQFVATVLAKTCNIQFSAFKNEINKHFKRDLTIPLPLKSGTNPSDYTQDDIDWDYMERFMSQFQNLAKNRLEQLTQTQNPKDTTTSDSSEVFVLRKGLV